MILLCPSQTRASTLAHTTGPFTPPHRLRWWVHLCNPVFCQAHDLHIASIRSHLYICTHFFVFPIRPAPLIMARTWKYARNIYFNSSQSADHYTHKYIYMQAEKHTQTYIQPYIYTTIHTFIHLYIYTYICHSFIHSFTYAHINKPASTLAWMRACSTLFGQQSLLRKNQPPCGYREHQKGQMKWWYVNREKQKPRSCTAYLWSPGSASSSAPAPRPRRLSVPLGS